MLSKLKLKGIEFQNYNIKIEEAKTKETHESRNLNQFKPQFVTNRNPEIQHTFQFTQRIVPGELIYSEALQNKNQNYKEFKTRCNSY